MTKHIMQNESLAEIALFRSAFSNVYRARTPVKQAKCIKCTWASPNKPKIGVENGNRL